MGELRDRAAIAEFEISQHPADIVEQILAHKARIVGIGVYIWNVRPLTEVVALLKRLCPQVIVVLGGPEVSHETDEQEIVRLADHVITGEADLAFAQLCRQLLAGASSAHVIHAEPPAFQQIVLPYELYSDDDLAHRVVYVEASRGCPFECEFCLSSLDVPVRGAPVDAFLGEMQKLLDRGLLRFKFVDRTFNLNVNVGREILRFFHERYRPGLFLHFEMIPDRLPEALRQQIAAFPAGSLQLEIGVQTFNEDVAARISRRQDNAKVVDNFHFLREHTGVHIHADLIVGLPGESLDSFAAGFDRLVALEPQEIQVGMLKRLRGAPIARHTQEWSMVYSPQAPYEIVQNSLIDFVSMQRLRRFARYWDLVANSGNFAETTRLIWRDVSPFWSFLRLSDWLYAQSRRTHGIALTALAEMVLRHLTAEDPRPEQVTRVGQALWRDYQRAGRSDKPSFLRDYIGSQQGPIRPCSPVAGSMPRRQARHLEGLTPTTKEPPAL
jgi:hypothetical protein